MIDQQQLGVLRAIALRLDQQTINWVVTGSCGLALQGLPVTIHDIDLQTDQQGAYLLEELFAEYVVRAVRFCGTDRVQSHFGSLEIDGVQVEIMGDMQYRRPDGTWDAPVDFQRHKQQVQLHDLVLPVLALSYECEAYARLGRPNKVALLQQWIARQA
jgi:hypothetical protein